MRFLLWLGAVLTAVAAPSSGYGADSAVVFLYNRFGDSSAPSTSVRVEQLKAQVEALKAGNYTVLPLAEIAERIRSGRGVPDRTIGLSIDDGYRSVYDVAFPILKAAGLPFTVFVATDQVGSRDMMSWSQIREIAAAGNTIGGRAAGRPHMAAQGLAENRAELARAKRAFETELGAAPRLFSWPYGEYALALKPLAEEFGFAAAFGQHWGVVGPASDFLFLPRFPLNENYGEIERFKLAARSLDLPVAEVTPADPLITAKENPPAFGFTVGDGVGALDSLRCYTDGQKVDVQRLGDRRVELRFEQPYPPGRSRLNCTLPSEGGRWRWFGTQFYVTRK
jgi:peptidoglycan/xylan/chitin deacetylase (PgdA/CDA1 family)